MSTTTTQAVELAVGTRLGASLDLAHAAARREELLAHAAMHATVLDLSAVTSCDLAGLQLLAAARATAAANQVPLRLEQPSPAVLAACTTFGIDLQSAIAQP
jgi:anti-anti-sigma regulatory factor